MRVPVVDQDHKPLMPTTPARATQGIYRIRNLVNGKIYIGSSLNLRRRKLVHFSCLRGGYHDNVRLQGSFNKHGGDSFVFEVLEVTNGLSPSELLAVEQLFLDEYTPFDRNIGYNINQVANAPSIEVCRLGGKTSGAKVGRANTLNGTLVKATSAAAHWKAQNPESVKRIATQASLKALEYWKNNPEKKASQITAAQLSAQKSNTKKWIVIDPNGIELEIENMTQFCRSHDLDPSVMTKIAKGNPRQKTHKGWRCRYA